MRAGIVGVGKLGGAVAQAFALDGTWDELVLCDAAPDLAWAQAEDLRHGFARDPGVEVFAGELADLAGSDVVVLAAGQGRKPGMTRLDLLHANAGLVADMSQSIARAARNATLLVLTNPVDVMTTVAWSATGRPRDRILGSGTLVDSVRLRTALAELKGVPVAEVDATVLGEHGDRAVPIFSRARVHGRPLDLTPEERDGLLQEVRGIAARIIDVKGGTAFGPAGCTATLARAVVAPTASVLPASVVLEGEYGLRDVAVGVPAVVGQGGVIKVEEWPLRSEEQAALQEAGRDLAGFVEDAAVVLGLAVRHTTLDRLTSA